MRSEQVFRAHETVPNRYLLCRATARVTRCLHFASGSTHDAIIDAFVRVATERNLLDVRSADSGVRLSAQGPEDTPFADAHPLHTTPLLSAGRAA